MMGATPPTTIIEVTGISGDETEEPIKEAEIASLSLTSSQLKDKHVCC